MFRKKSKFSCVFCSDTKEKSKDKINFCRDCQKLRNYIRDKGMDTIQNFINNSKEKIIPSCPPY